MTVRMKFDKARLGGSLKVTLKQAVESRELQGLFQPGVKVCQSRDRRGLRHIEGTRRLRELGYVPVPHIAAVVFLESLVGSLSKDAGVRDVLVVGGGVGKPVAAALMRVMSKPVRNNVPSKYSIMDVIC